jgi:uncharacterized protein (TIGR03437 family)
VSYTVSANTGASSRTGHITAAGQTFTITQAGAGGGTTSGNLIQNGDAESGPAIPGTGAAPSIPGWSTDGNISVAAYTDSSGDLTPTSPGPSNRGNNYFAGGPNNASSRMTQTVDLSSYAAAIDAGTQPYTLDGWLGGLSTQNDNTAVTVTFQNASGGSLGTATIGPVSAADRGGVSELVERSTSGNVPTGTRKMLVTVTFTRTDGMYNDGMLDNLSFVLGSGAGTSITINNPGFETIPSNPVWSDCSGSGGAGCRNTYDGNIPGWSTSGSISGLFQPGPADFTLPLPAAEGQTVAFTNGGTISQVLSATLQASTLYTLQVDVGRYFTNLYSSPPPTVQLFAGNIPIAAATGAQPPLGGWTTWTGTYTSSSSDPLAGQTLKIVLGATNPQGDFDNVRLTAAQTGGTACTYSLSPTSASPGAAQTNGTITVTAGSGCTWTAASNATSWLTITGGASGTGNGTVSYTVAANTSTASRTGTITVGGQTFTVTQAAAAACSYLIAPTSYNMAAQGGSSSFTVTVSGSSCSWTASVSSNATSWLHLGSTTSGTTNGSVSFSGDANTSMASRNGTIAVANQTFTVTQAGGASATAPSIAAGGIVNAVSNRGGGIAQGSMFTIYGSNLGPTVGWTAYQFPIPDTVNNVVVNVTAGSSTPLRAYLLFVRADQINAIMPSSTPLGSAQITVTYNGVISAASPVTIVATAIGINSSAYGPGPGIIKNYISDANQPYNTASTPAKPGQTEIIVGTGLGPIPTPDNVSPAGGNLPVTVQVLVGGIQVTPGYSGRAPGNAGQDQINFTVPANAPLGCSVPVQVSAGGTWSNTVRMAISADGKHCQDSFNPYAGLSTTGGKSGTIGLIRVNFSGQLDPTQPSTTAQLDLGLGAFALTNPGTDFSYSPITNLPPPGSCAASNKMLDLGAIMGDGGSSLDPTIAAGLDAGPQLTVTGGAGGATGTISQTSTATDPNSPYMGLLGGILNIEGATVPPPFLDGGPFTVSGPGGKDVWPFSTTVGLAPAIHWTNPPSTINRSSPLTLTWTGGNSSQLVLILGGSTDQTSKASGGFVCLAQATAGTFTVPVNALADLISTAGATSSNGPVGILGLMPLQPGSMNLTPLPKGLDVGVVFDTTLTVQTVQVQ